MPSTIFDVAQRAGVSKSTVSRVFNNGSGVASEIIESVRKAAAELGYNSFKANARGRPKKDTGGIRSGSVALLIPDSSEDAMRTPLSGSLAQGVSRALSKNRINMIFTNLLPDERLPICVEKRQVDGIVIRAADGLDALARRLGEIPFVVALESSASTDSMKADFVQPDNRAVAELAVNYLVDQGCGNLIAVYDNPTPRTVLERTFEFSESSARIGIGFSTCVEKRPLEEIVRSVFSVEKRPDGIFLPVGDLAVGEACRALERMGIRPVDDVKIIACNNAPEYIWAVDRRMPNINIRAEMVGQMAAESLLERIKTPRAEFRRILVRPQLEFKSN